MLDIIVRSYGGLLLRTLTPAEVLLCWRAAIVASRATGVVRVGRAVEVAMLGRRVALGIAASTWLPAPRIQVPKQVLALLQEGLLLTLRILEDDKFAVTHLLGGQFLLLRSLSGQLCTGGQLAYLAVSALRR